jgi:hypothetical protein
VVSFEQHHFNIAAAQFTQLVGGQRRVTQVDYYVSPVTTQQFRAKEAALQQMGVSTDKTWVFHGTAAQNLPPIMSTGFLIGGRDVAVAVGTACGHGVYSATGPDAGPIGYAGASNSVILAQGLKGRCKNARNAEADHSADSWSGGRADWCIFRTKEQVLPVYVVHFQ